MNRQDMPRVAAIWLEAAWRGEAPVAAVAEAFTVPHRTASHWVKQARMEGLLPTTDESHVRHKKLQAVADAVGVDYGKLRAAILEHAGGDLRIR